MITYQVPSHFVQKNQHTQNIDKRTYQQDRRTSQRQAVNNNITFDKGLTVALSNSIPIEQYNRIVNYFLLATTLFAVSMVSNFVMAGIYLF